MGCILNGYSRCLIQGQDKHSEVWVEKDALAGIFEEVVYPYCIRAVVCRGYQSVTFPADFYSRAEQAIMNGQEVIVLYFGDLNPSGVQMLEASIGTLEKELDLYEVDFKRVALNLGRVARGNFTPRPSQAGSRPGAVPENPFPAPASSNAACGFPALYFQKRFTPC